MKEQLTMVLTCIPLTNGISYACWPFVVLSSSGKSMSSSPLIIYLFFGVGAASFCGACAFACSFMWKPDVNLRCCSLGAFHLAFWDIVSHWHGVCQLELADWPTSWRDLPVSTASALALEVLDIIAGFFSIGFFVCFCFISGWVFVVGL